MIRIDELLADLKPGELVLIAGEYYNAASLQAYATLNKVETVDGAHIISKRNLSSRVFVRNLGTAFEGEPVMATTIAEVRTSAVGLPGVVVIDGVLWSLDASDSSTVDDGVGVLVSVGGRRYKASTAGPQGVVENKQKEVAKRIHQLLTAKGALPTVMTPLPTIALIGGYAPSIPNSFLTVADNYAKLNYMGSIPRTYIPSGPGLAFVYAANVVLGADGRNAGGKQGLVMKVVFGTDADKVEIPIMAENNYNKSYRIWVDGQVTAVAARNDLTDYTYQRLVLTFSSAKPRNIIVEIGQFVSFGGVEVGPRYSVYRVSPDPIRVVYMGDSYSAGTGSNDFINGYVNQVASLLGVNDVINSSKGGIGYLQVGALSGLYARQKLDTDVTLYNPQVVIGAFGINDYQKTASPLQTEVSSYWNKVLADNPDALCIAVGPFTAPGPTVSLALSNAIKNGVAAASEFNTRLFYIDTISKVYQSGTGRVGATQTTGNSSIYIGTDNVHPNQAGHDYLAKRVSEDIKDIINILANVQ